MITRKTKRIISMLLCLVLTAGWVAASDAYGPEVYKTEIEIGEGTNLDHALFWSDTYSQLRAESYIEYFFSNFVYIFFCNKTHFKV